VLALCGAWLLVACGSSNAGGLSQPGSGGAPASEAGAASAIEAGGSPSSSSGSAGAPAHGAASGNGGSGAAGAPGIGGANPASGSCNQPTVTTPTPCNAQYPATSVLSLRTGKAAGCFELSHVGLVARTDSPTEPRLYLQDPGGADTSAILAKCTASATHACAPEVKAKIPLLFDTLDAGAQLSVRGYYQVGALSGFEEFYIEDIIDECKQVARPAPIALTVSDLTRDARTPARWFRRATVNIPASDPLVVYDFSPPELLLGLPQCPDYAGFAMIQTSLSTASPASCAGQANPAPRSAADPHEILVGRQFFNQFLFSADCACTTGTNQKLLKASNAVSGSVLGYLILEQDKASAAAYQVFEPAADQSFPIR
jgi:hypothetical protein